MTISTRAELRTAINTRLVRSESNAQLDEFIQEGENELNVKLRLLQQEAATPSTVTLSSGANVADLPSTSSVTGLGAFLELITLRWNDLDGPGPEQMPLDAVRNAYTATTGRPSFVAVSSSFVFERPADQAYTLKSVHYAKWALGASTGDTNWLLTNFPYAYLYAALTAAASGFLRSAKLTAEWGAQRNMWIGKLNDMDARARKIGATLRVDSGLTGRAGSRYDINRG